MQTLTPSQEKSADSEQQGDRPRIVVDPSGRGNFCSLSDAIEASTPGTDLILRPGTYRERLLLDRPVTLIGEGAVEDIIIQAMLAPTLVQGGGDVHLRNLSLRGIGGDGTESAILVAGGRLVMDRCLIHGSLGPAVVSCGSGVVILRTCAIDGGVAVHPGGQLGLVDCELVSGWPAALNVQTGGRLEARSCQFREGRIAFRVEANTHTQLHGCEMAGFDTAGVVIEAGAAPLLRECRIHSNAGRGVWVRGGTGLLDGCDISGNRRAGVDIEAGANPTLRNCQIRDGAWVGVRVQGNGSGLLDACELYGNRAAAVLVEQRGQPTLRDCRVFEGNDSGGLLFRAGAAGLLEGCDIHSNPHPGVIICDGASPIIRQCQIRNGGHHGVLFHAGGLGELHDCEISGNALAGVAIEQGSDPTLLSCRVRDNKHAGIFVGEDGLGNIESCEMGQANVAGLLVESGGNVYVKNCKISHSDQAGVAVLEGGRVRLAECVVTDNRMTGVMVGEGGEAIMEDCNLLQNDRPALRVEPDGRCQVAGGNVSSLDLAPGGLLQRGQIK